MKDWNIFHCKNIEDKKHFSKICISTLDYPFLISSNRLALSGVVIGRFLVYTYLILRINSKTYLPADFKCSFTMKFLPNPTYYSFFTLRRVLIIIKNTLMLFVKFPISTGSVWELWIELLHSVRIFAPIIYYITTIMALQD